MSRCVAITGGTGFIGKRLVQKHLDLGDKVRVLTRSKSIWKGGFHKALTLFEGDLSKAGADLTGFVDGADVLYHCAGEIRDESKMEALHVDATRRLLEAAQGRVKHWVQLSSCGVYGCPREGDVDENFPLRGVGVYERTKLTSEQVVIEEAEKMGMTYTVLRPANVYAADMPNESLRQWIRMIQKGLFFYIGKPGAQTNYIHVNDVVSALVLAATNPNAKNKIYNLSNPLPIEMFVRDVCNVLHRSNAFLRVPEVPLRMVTKVLGWLPRWPLSEAKINVLTTRAVFNTGRIETELGWGPNVSLADGIGEFQGAYRDE